MKRPKKGMRKELKGLSLEVRAEMALKEAVAEAIAEHKRRGNRIALWRNGRAVWISPEKIVVSQQDDTIP